MKIVFNFFLSFVNMLTDTCTMSIHLAYLMLCYVLASIYYLYLTKNIGTPLKDSYTKKQKEIRKKSANIRRKIFYQGIVTAGIILYLWQPFKKCK